MRMNYKLNEYHQGVTDDELVEDVKRISSLFNNKYLSIKKYETMGKYTETTFRKHFGSWQMF